MRKEYPNFPRDAGLLLQSRGLVSTWYGGSGSLERPRFPTAPPISAHRRVVVTAPSSAPSPRHRTYRACATSEPLPHLRYPIPGLEFFAVRLDGFPVFDTQTFRVVDASTRIPTFRSPSSISFAIRRRRTALRARASFLMRKRPQRRRPSIGPCPSISIGGRACPL